MPSRRSVPGALLVLAVLGGAAAGVVLWRPDLAPHTREQARIMSSDPVWAGQPPQLTETRRWTTYARPAWLPWQPAVPRTMVGRHYDFTGAANDAFDAWQTAALQAGWRPVPVQQTRANGTEVWFLRESGRWPARLVVRHNELTGVFTVSIVMPPPEVVGASASSPTTVDPCRAPDPEAGQCGIPFSELRELNLRHADRLDFTGDIEAAHGLAVAAEERLRVLVEAGDVLSTDTIHEALSGLADNVTVADDAVRTSGVAFALDVAGGCVFGNIHDGSINIDIGGYVRDGGCLATYGH